MKKIYNKLAKAAKKDGYQSVEEYFFYSEAKEVSRGIDEKYDRMFIMDIPKYGEFKSEDKINVRMLGRNKKGE